MPLADSIPRARGQIRTLLDDTAPAEAPTTYYALFHPAAKSQLYVAQAGGGKLAGFLAICQTGMDLFRPLVTLICQTPEVAADLMAEALVVGRPYIFFAPINQLPMVGGSLHIERQTIFQVYVINSARFQPEVNVLVRASRTPEGTPRCEMRDGERSVAQAGVNWQSPAFAEVYVRTESAARGRGLGKNVVSCVVGALLKEGIRAVYLAETSNEASHQLAQSVGFIDTGSRQVYGEAVYTGHPTRET
ncbi:MAG: GNAT family N-acetyltransferase [Anaerolineales bacterium]